MASLTHFLLLFSCLRNTFFVLGFQSDFALFPVAKDTSTLQYVATISHGTPFKPTDLVLDLGGPFLWMDCDSEHVSSSNRFISSCSVNCSRANFHDLGRSKSCLFNTNCYVSPHNGVTRSTSIGELVKDFIAVDSVDRITTVDHFLFACAKIFHLQGLASGAKGIMGLGKASISLPSQLSSSIGHSQKFTLCLSSSNGVVLTGNGDSIFGTRITRSLSYTPLLTKQSDYFIHVQSIKINGRRLVGGNLEAKLSTIVPYTTVESSIYAIFCKAYVEAATLMNMTKVAPVGPFGLCFSSEGVVGNSKVPEVDIVLQSEMVKWRIQERNLMVKVGKERMCVGILDGGVEQSSPIVIGGLQMEDYLLEFDFGTSMLGFSSSLLFKETSCSMLGFSSSLLFKETSCSTSLQDSKLKQFI